MNARKEFQHCLGAENPEPFDWGLSGVQAMTGVDVWEGLHKP
jgi:hypothetical protein